MKIKYLIILAICILAVGCKSTPPPQKLNVTYVATNAIPAIPLDNAAESQLVEASTSVSTSLQQLAAIELAKNPRIVLASTSPSALDMTQQSSVDWYGPVEPILEKIAQTGHYQLRVLGVPPAIPVFITVYSRDRPLADILRDVIYQAHDKAQVVVYPQSRTIELRYLAP